MLDYTCKSWGYALSVLIALGTGPVLIPFFINTDPIINIYSQTTNVQPISGWYGPGAWLAYILTTLNALRRLFSLCWHMVMNHTYWDRVKCAHCPKEDWDADWLVSLIYTSISSVDLIRLSIAIIRSDKLVEIQSLPAIQAAATAVYVGSSMADLALTAMILMACVCGNQSGFFMLRWRLFITIGALYIIGLIGVVLHQKAIRAQYHFVATMKQGESWPDLSVGLLSEAYGLRALAFDTERIKLDAMMSFMSWSDIIYRLVFYGVSVYAMFWCGPPNLILGGIGVFALLLFWLLYIPILKSVMYYFVTVGLYSLSLHVC
jgi:hypothetical protein